jgi:hypothetical protein
MIQKKLPSAQFSTHSNRVELTDEDGGVGYLIVEGIGHPRYVQDPPPPGYRYGYWNGGHYEYDHWRVVGTTVPETYPQSFALKHYQVADGPGFVLPASVAGATLYGTREEAVALAERWIAAGGPGLGLEHPEVTKRRRLEAQSAYARGKAEYWFSQMTDEDLVKLGELAQEYIAKRVERAAKAAARAEEKKRKAAEKAHVAAEKAAAKAEKARVAAEKAAARAEKKAASDAKKAEREAKKAQAAAQSTAAPA